MPQFFKSAFPANSSQTISGSGQNDCTFSFLGRDREQKRRQKQASQIAAYGILKNENALMIAEASPNIHGLKWGTKRQNLKRIAL